jgi:hypothetical protein
VLVPKTTNACVSAAENRKFIRGRPIDSVCKWERAKERQTGLAVGKVEGD